MTRQKFLSVKSELIAVEVKRSSVLMFHLLSDIFLACSLGELLMSSSLVWAGSISLPCGPLPYNRTVISVCEQAMQLALPHIFSLASYADAAFCIL